MVIATTILPSFAHSSRATKIDRKSTRLNSSHLVISYAVFCLKKSPLSQNIIFKDLGLLMIDDEQKFGVAAKEKLKQCKTKRDIFFFNATPTPRTHPLSLPAALPI